MNYFTVLSEKFNSFFKNFRTNNNRIWLLVKQELQAILESLYNIRESGLYIFTLEFFLLLCLILSFYHNVSKEEFDKSLYKAHFNTGDNDVLERHVDAGFSAYQNFSELAKNQYSKSYAKITENLELLGSYSNNVWSTNNYLDIISDLKALKYESTEPLNIYELKETDFTREKVLHSYDSSEFNNLIESRNKENLKARNLLKRFLLIDGFSIRRDFTVDSQITAQENKKEKELRIAEGVPLIFINTKTENNYYFIIGESKRTPFDGIFRNELYEHRIVTVVDQNNRKFNILVFPLETRAMLDRRTKELGITEESKKLMMEEAQKEERLKRSK